MTNTFDEYLQTTPMLDFEHRRIQQLIRDKKWRELDDFEAIGAVYAFVQNDIKFGYNSDDRLPASEVLANGYGQCNTKGTLLLALLRALAIPARFHGFTINNELQKGAIPGYLFFFAPKRIIHSWVEVYQGNSWINLEGYIIDNEYLQQVQQRFAEQCESFSGFGIATKCLRAPQVNWTGANTYIQREGIADDLGVYAQPDEFYQAHGSNLSGIKKWLFRYALRHLMNLNVNKIRRFGIMK